MNLRVRKVTGCSRSAMIDAVSVDHLLTRSIEFAPKYGVGLRFGRFYQHGHRSAICGRVGLF